MFKCTFLLVLLSLVLLSVSVSEVPQSNAVALDSTVRDFPKCPCKCFAGRRKRRAKRQCRRFRFRYQCTLSECIPLYGRFHRFGIKGLKCCEKVTPLKPIPTSTATATPSKRPIPTSTATATATPSPKIECPCVCTDKALAIHACRYKPYCVVFQCPLPHHHHVHIEKFQCCDKAPVAPSKLPLPTSTATATATPSKRPIPTSTATATATPSPKPDCPCVCTDKDLAIHACRYKPLCEVTQCPLPHHHHLHLAKFKCCHKLLVAPH